MDTIEHVDPQMLVLRQPDPLSLRLHGKTIATVKADGTTEYDWPGIEALAATWEPGNCDMSVALAKLLQPLRPLQ